MTEPVQHKIRLRLPTGAELEAEGSADFVSAERRHFVSMLQPNASGSAMLEAAGASDPALAGHPPWETILEARGGGLQLRAKLRGDQAEQDASLILLAAAKALLKLAKPTAAQLAKWLRTSGYPIGRVDRIIQGCLERGEILASGSRRARRYELSGPGFAKAFRCAFEQAAFIHPRPPVPAQADPAQPQE
ncbi:MAG: hypothetical protein A2X36_00325 [Elusimicrobia bacterium GWA2_69_24]|nr:MAG: hypothetical protein A2X36_00325 [Elusimicrobia bacterium GWA2_69_24]HBL16756.1 hypothetical protein [Elusimicrobiota bacterium]